MPYLQIAIDINRIVYNAVPRHRLNVHAHRRLHSIAPVRQVVAREATQHARQVCPQEVGGEDRNAGSEILRNLEILEDLWTYPKKSRISGGFMDLFGWFWWGFTVNPPYKMYISLSSEPRFQLWTWNSSKKPARFFRKIGRLKVFAPSSPVFFGSKTAWDLHLVFLSTIQVKVFQPAPKKKSDPSMVVVWDIDRKGQRVVVNVCFWIGCSFLGDIHAIKVQHYGPSFFRWDGERESEWLFVARNSRELKSNVPWLRGEKAKSRKNTRVSLKNLKTTPSAIPKKTYPPVN